MSLTKTPYNLKLSSFSILTFFVCLAIIGASLIPLLTVQLTPSAQNSYLNISYHWRGTSAKVLEDKVTSKLEGLFNRIKDIKSISSNSRKGGGSISLSFKKEVDMDAVRFEISNLIRQIYPDLPNGVSYPFLSKSSPNEYSSPILSYSVSGRGSPYQIKKYVEREVVPKLSVIKGLSRVGVYGATPFEWQIIYNSDQLLSLGLTVNELRSAIVLHLENRELGTGVFVNPDNKKELHKAIILRFRDKGEVNWESIVIKKSGDRIIRLGDIAKVTFKEGEVGYYYRVNGLSGVNMVIYPKTGVNAIDLAKEIREKVSNIADNISKDYEIRLTNDTTLFIKEELTKIQKRALFSLLILLLLIVLVYRSFRYTLLLLASIITNLLIGVVFYYLFKVELQLYSFAGITISFGIIIDNSIIMIDHIRQKGNSKVFLAILAATFTTIGALVVILFLEEQQRTNLLDFAIVIVINISVSLAVSLFFVPSLLDKMQLKKYNNQIFIKRKRRVFKFTEKYIRLIMWLKKPILKWTLLLLMLLGFGLPIHLLPKEELKGEDNWSILYNKTLGSEWFYNNLRPILEKVVGGSLRLFTEYVIEDSYYVEPERTMLRISGRMPEGCTIAQLNQAILKMEDFIKGFDEIELFETNISSYRNSSIRIYFKEDYEFGDFPYILKRQIESKVISLGGLDWSIAGVGRGFSNALNTGYKMNRISVEGYNYDALYRYAEILQKNLLDNSSHRIKEVDITGGSWYNQALYEYYLNFDKEKLSVAKVSPRELYSYLKNKVYKSNLPPIFKNQEMHKVKLVSDQYDHFNVWDMKNTLISSGERQYKLHKLAEVEKKNTGNIIIKQNQQYLLTILYDFIGTPSMAKKVINKQIEWLKQKLPIGYKVKKQSYYDRWNKKERKQYYYLFIVVGIIFMICAIVLESLKQAFLIIVLLPISFIGTFLTFYIFEFNFDQGGYASFILLCGISVNSALYIINDYNSLKKEFPHRNKTEMYFKAFNYKIIPIILTIISTIVGLIPFVWGGQNEAFWFAFAVGSIGGLLFSIIGLIFYLPLLILKP